VGATPTDAVNLRSEETPSAERRRHHRTWAASIVVLGLMLSTWPFLRTPLLGMGLSYAHLLGAWLVVVVALGLLARAIGRDVRAGGDRA
jgi:hypothetical protein